MTTHTNVYETEEQAIYAVGYYFRLGIRAVRIGKTVTIFSERQIVEAALDETLIEALEGEKRF